MIVMGKRGKKEGKGEGKGGEKGTLPFKAYWILYLLLNEELPAQVQQGLAGHFVNIRSQLGHGINRSANLAKRLVSDSSRSSCSGGRSSNPTKPRHRCLA